MKIYTGTSNPELSQKVVDILKYDYNGLEKSLSSLSIEKFSDGEILPRFNESVRDQDVLFIQSTNSAESIMETLLVLDAAKRAGCASFTLIAPFQGYSRQDKTDHIRSSIGSKVMANILTAGGLDKLITIDLHASAIQGFYDIPVIHLNGNKIFTGYIKSLNLDNLVICSPDQGAIKRNADFAKAFPEATFALINKKRIKPNEIHSMELMGDVQGKNVVIVDDMADTLGTLKKASDLLIANGAKSVRAIATHGVLSGKAFENLEQSHLTELIVSDTIKIDKTSDKLKVISCDKILATTIHQLQRRKSVHEINEV
jgi:ribose-phosphate pyrophosphokinase